MTLADLKTLLDFHYWARDRVLHAAGRLTPEQFTRDMGASFKSVRDTLSHLYSADWGWYQLWQGISPTAPPLEEFPDVVTLRNAWTAHESQMRAFLNSLVEVDVNEYRMLKGSTASFSIGRMVQHVVNHGSYHRGQLTMMFRQLGVEPGSSMDLIRYYREQSVKAEAPHAQLQTSVSRE
ncbi:MAG TPA: DinB family protein [Bryobacteraceae bacterium]|nr:DinB family protein [Bryobacteraceae bacterium]